jgi:hypothetical protein
MLNQRFFIMNLIELGLSLALDSKIFIDVT